MFRIGGIEIPSRVLQAPMVACTDLPFRLLAREHGLGLAFAEMVSAQALSRENLKTLGILKTAPEDRPLGAQILGCDPELAARAARRIEELGFDLIDINLGCPVRKVVSNGEGAALLKEPGKAARIFESVRKAVSIPVTVKTRAGFDDPSGEEAAAVARAAQDCGLSAVSVHGRTQKQGYSGKADYAAVARVKAAVKIPVIGNGDVFSPQAALDLMRISGCDAVMLARGTLGNPWLYRNVERAISGSKEPPALPSIKERESALLRHFELEVRFQPERDAALNMRRIAVWYTQGLPGNKKVRAAICQTMDLPAIRGLIEDYFAGLPRDVPPPAAPILLHGEG